MTILPNTIINRLAETRASLANIAQLGDKVHKLGCRLGQVNDLDSLYQSLVTEWLQATDMVTNGRLPVNLIDDRSQWPQITDPVARMMAIDGLTYLPDDILTKVDRASMAVSLEVRAPFLDRDIIEFAWSLPMSMKIRKGQSKWLLRQVLNRYVPRELIEGPKRGFTVPLDIWLRGPLREWAEDLLSERRLRDEGFFDPAPIRAAWQAQLHGSSFGYRLWSVLMFQAWLDHQRK